MSLPPVGSSLFNATSFNSNLPLNSLTLLVGATLTALAVGGSLFYCRLEARPVPAYFHLGQQAFQKGNFQEAVGHYESALSLRQASSAKVYYERGRAYLELKDYDAASEDCKKALTRLQDARSPLDPPSDPDLPLQVFCLKADISLAQGDYKAAMLDCQKALVLKNNNKKLFQKAHLIFALAHYLSRNYRAAMDHCNKAITYNDEDRAMASILLYNQALCHIQQGEALNAHYSLEWAPIGFDELQFSPSLLRYALPLPTEWQVKIATDLPPSQQIRQKIDEAFRRTKNSLSH